MVELIEVYEVLDNLLEKHTDLLQLSVEKKDTLINGNIEELMRITKQEAQLIKAIEVAEFSRIERVNNIFSTKGVPLSSGTLLELTKIITDIEAKNKLNKYRQDLLTVVTELSQTNELNQQLLEQSLSFINLNLELMTDTPEEDYIYKRPTQSSGNPKINRSFFNRQA